MPREQLKGLPEEDPGTQSPGHFRMLTDEEIEERLKLDIKSFKFYEELKENDNSGS
ncbi:MAG: hypothetical protein PVI38_21215 [Desulfobacterales bacterium]|jgi:hypothetical protein